MHVFIVYISVLSQHLMTSSCFFVVAGFASLNGDRREQILNDDELKNKAIDFEAIASVCIYKK